MAGRPKLRRLSQMIEREGGDDAVFERIAAGHTVSAIMGDYGFTRHFFYSWLKAGGEERRLAFEEAKRLSADALVDQGLEILDAPGEDGFPVTSAEISHRKERANYRKWLAGVRSDEYADKPQVHAEISVGGLYLEALQKHGYVSGKAQAAEVEEADYDLLPEETDD